MSYKLEGQLLEFCSCNVLCPCWLGQDPDGGKCEGFITYTIEKGTINDINVSGLSIVIATHIPGNILNGNWRVVIFIDDKSTTEQEEALLSAFGGKIGGPLADLAQLVGEIIGVERAPMTIAVKNGKGTMHVGNTVETEVVPLQGATGKSTTVYDSVFTTISESPAYVAKASTYKAKVPALGFDVDLQNHSAVHTRFQFQG
jgi:hypothetical protein